MTLDLNRTYDRSPNLKEKWYKPFIYYFILYRLFITLYNLKTKVLQKLVAYPSIASSLILAMTHIPLLSQLSLCII
ncbi:hypothetical protein DFH28DRAFT_983486 [Melampsora americana]|nr:hypothetical protein DFH28DRAFT_983486 [Melampsora americana]